MIGRKISTYSRRKPFTVNREDKEEDKGEEIVETRDNLPYDEHLLNSISASIRKLDILPLPVLKSRKSEIRPRKSIAPSSQEFSDLLKTCKQPDEIPFEAWFKETSEHWPTCVKIGESSFSEVFKMTTAGGDSIAVKIMPLLKPSQIKEPLEGKSPEPIQLEHLLHEIRSLQALETLGDERKCVVVGGKYPDNLLEKWAEWTFENGTFNDKPGTVLHPLLMIHLDFYMDDSLHVILMMEFGGVNLENYKLVSISQIRSILAQILSSMSLAEEHLCFEHRDLHLGNVLIRPTHRPDIRLGNYRTIPTDGIMSSIIDCSLARFRGSNGVEFRDLRDEEWLFTGDAKESAQYQIYRNMRDVINEEWKDFNPKTNLIWIAHLTFELLSKYEKLGKKETELYTKLQDFVEKLPNYKDCKEAFGDLIQ